MKKLARIENHTFIKSVLSSESNVIDIGFNVGGFSKNLHDEIGCTIKGIEADPRLAKHNLEEENIRVENFAVSNKDGKVKLKIPKVGDASIGLQQNGKTVSVDSVSLNTLIDNFDSEIIDLIKMDIEGAEVEALKSLKLENAKRVSQITVEFHDFIDSTLSKDVNNVNKHMRDMGFKVIKFSRNNTDILYINKRYINVGFFGGFYLKLVGKYIAGIIRKCKRIVKYEN